MTPIATFPKSPGAIRDYGLDVRACSRPGDTVAGATVAAVPPGLVSVGQAQWAGTVVWTRVGPGSGAAGARVRLTFDFEMTSGERDQRSIALVLATL
jgi:hypothetical protein